MIQKTVAVHRRSKYKNSNTKTYTNESITIQHDINEKYRDVSSVRPSNGNTVSSLPTQLYFIINESDTIHCGNLILARNIVVHRHCSKTSRIITNFMYYVKMNQLRFNAIIWPSKISQWTAMILSILGEQNWRIQITFNIHFLTLSL